MENLAPVMADINPTESNRAALIDIYQIIVFLTSVMFEDFRTVVVNRTVK